jgi:CPA1 family monovalent cation:H+ antiporter
MHLPRPIVSILEGESLVNDATGLVLYKLALAAVLSGVQVTFASASLDFLKLALGGLLLGAALGFLMVQIQRFFEDPVLATTASLLISFGTYIAAEHLHLSGVLAVVAAGLVQGRCFPLMGTSEIRLHATNVWRTVIFLLEALRSCSSASSFPKWSRRSASTRPA